MAVPYNKRTHKNGELRKEDEGQEVILVGWAQNYRDLGGMAFIDIRDYTGITQVKFNPQTDPKAHKLAGTIRREDVIAVRGNVILRGENVNPKLPTGEIEVEGHELDVLAKAETPPFEVDDEIDASEDARLKYRVVDLRRPKMQKILRLRHRLARAAREHFNALGFVEIETPVLGKSTPEGARDYLVPSRVYPGKFFALPQSPQLYKQLFMMAGFDRYCQVVRCFRDEDLRADRQPEFTQIDCEMAFVEQDDVLQAFEGMTRHLLKEIKGVEVDEFPRMPYSEAMGKYGSDKPDIRFGMEFVDLNDVAQGKGFNVFDSAELVVGICAPGCGEYSRKQLDALTDFVKKPQIGARGMVYVKCNPDGSFKSSVDKFYSQDDLKAWAEKAGANAGDLLLVLSGEAESTRKQLCELRLEMGNQLGLRDTKVFRPLWVVDFPLLEWDDETERFYAMHHPFTSPKKDDISLLESDPGKVRANAYDLVINGVEIGGGSIRIHNKELQKKMFSVLGFTDEEAQEQFGFLMNAFEYGAPPHGGIALGFDRLVALFGGQDSIRDFIAFPKNNAGRDMMIDSPSSIAEDQLEELSLKLEIKEKNKA